MRGVFREKGDLSNFLASKDFVIGKYHDACDLRAAIDEYFDAKTFPTFEEAKHTSLSQRSMYAQN